MNKNYPLENIRLFVERLSSYCQDKEQSAHIDSSETKKKIEEDTLPEIKALTRQWEEMLLLRRDRCYFQESWTRFRYTIQVFVLR